MARPKPTKVEHCLLILLIFGRDLRRMPIDDLVMYAMGLKAFKDVQSMTEARLVIQDIINDLISRRMIKLCGDATGRETEEEFDNQYVQMLDDGLHSANLIASKYKLTILHHDAYYDWERKLVTEKFYGLSLVLVRVRFFFYYMKNSKLTILLLQYGAGTKCLPTYYFRGMKNLRIRSLVGPSVSQSFSGLRHLQTLRLKVLDPSDLSWIGGLKSLKYLHVASLSLWNVPKELGQLGNLRLLDFRKTEFVYIPPGVLSRMLKLEELYLPLSFIRWGCSVEDEDDHDHDGLESREEDDRNGRQRINACLSEIASLKSSALRVSAQNA